MKIKHLLCVLLTLSVLWMSLPAIPALAASNEISTSYDKTTKALTVTLPASPSAEAWLLAASYDADGRMVDTKAVTLPSGADTTQVIASLTPAHTYKVFLLNKSTLAPMYSIVSEEFPPDYDSLVSAKGQVYVPMIDGTVAHATAMAVDAYVEAKMATDQTTRLFQETSDTYLTADNQTENINKIATIAQSGTDAEKNAALLTIQTALSSLEQAVGAAAVLDAAAEKDMVQTVSALSAEMQLMSASDSRQENAEQWAEELSQAWDSLPKKDRLRSFAEQMGVDARTAYQALSDAQDILNGKYTDDANFYDICTRTAIGVKTASKVGVFVCATLITGGGAAAAGGLTTMNAVGTVINGVDCLVEIGRSGAKIVLGDDHEIVKKMEDSQTAKVYDTAMFIYGAATFDPKEATTGEKLLFIEDLAEKNISTYENVNVLMDEATGLVIDRIEDGTKKICVEYTRIQSENASDLAPAASDILGAENTGILEIDTRLDNGTITEQMQGFTAPMQSDDLSLAKTYAQVKDGAKTLSDKIDEFTQSCDEKVTYERQKKSDDDSGGGGGPSPSGSDSGGSDSGGSSGSSTEGGGSSSEGGGSSDTSGSPSVELPTPDMDFNEVKFTPVNENYACEYYYKNGVKVGEVEYIIDTDGRYWPTCERWKCGDDDWLITRYYQKDEEEIFSWSQYSNTGIYDSGQVSVKARGNGIVKEKYVEHYYSNESGSGWNYCWYDRVNYYPNGQIEKLEKYEQGRPISYYEYSPEGNIYRYEYGYNETCSSFNYTYQYYVYPCVSINFDPTGHLMKSYINGKFTEYHVSTKPITGDGEATQWGYSIYYGTSSGMDGDPSGWVAN